MTNQIKAILIMQPWIPPQPADQPDPVLISTLTTIIIGVVSYLVRNSVLLPIWKRFHKYGQAIARSLLKSMADKRTTDEVQKATPPPAPVIPDLTAGTTFAMMHERINTNSANIQAIFESLKAIESTMQNMTESNRQNMREFRLEIIARVGELITMYINTFREEMDAKEKTDGQ